MADGDAWVSFSWPGVPEPALDGPTATYGDVLPGVDLVVQAGAEGFSEYLVVKTAEAAVGPGLASLEFGLATSEGLSVAETDGALTVRGVAGEPVFTGPAPRMWDSAGAAVAVGALAGGGDEPAAVDALSERDGSKSAVMDLSVSGSQLTVVPDRNLLTDADTVFPVVVDPSLSRFHSSWLMVWSNGLEFYNHATEHARVGYDGWSGAPKVSRVFYTFSTSGLAGKVIDTAVFAHRQIHSPNHSCSASSYGPGVQLGRTDGFTSSGSWQGPTFREILSTSNVVHGHEDYCPGWTRTEWNAKPAIEDAAAGGWSAVALGLRSAGEGDRNGWRKFDNVASSYPILTVTYRSYPNTPGTPAFASTTPGYLHGSYYYVSTATPTLRATVSDPDGGNVRGRFQVYTGSTLVWEGYSGYVASGGTAQIAVPAGKLVDGVLYTVRVWGNDGALQSKTWSNYIQFYVDTVKPAAPVVTLTTPPAGVSMPGMVNADAPDADVINYVWGLNTDAPASVVAAPSPGAPANILFTPTKFGPNWITIISEDRARNRTVTPARIEFNVPGSLPTWVWRLDGNGGEANSTGMDVTVTGGSSWADGRWRFLSDGVTDRDPTDGALALDGSSGYAFTDGGLPLSTMQNFSVSAWVRADTTLTGNRVAVSHEGTQTNAWNLGHNAASNASWTFWMTLDDDPTSAQSLVQSTEAPVLGQWTHLVGVHDAAAEKIRLYVDGQMAGDVSYESDWNATGRLLVGRSRWGGWEVDHWPGNIDEVRVFEGALDDGQVMDVFNETRP